MQFSRYKVFIVILPILLASCGGGGGGGASTSSGTTTTTSASTSLSRVIQNAKFLLFPNPQRQGFNGADQTNTVAYATAYYTAVDPNTERDTFTKWKTKNGFTATDDGVNQVTVVFGDIHDLGYGRRMTARKNSDGSLAFFVENYLVDTGDDSSGYAYSSFNVDAAVVRSANRFVSYSAIEYSDLDGPGGTNGPKFVKFYSFPTAASSPSQPRNLIVDQDGLGTKAMPAICVSCHGGRGDPLTTDGKFPTIGNAASQQAGDTTSRLQLLKVHTFDFSSLSDALTGESRSRAAQEGKFRLINQWIRDTYSNTGANEWDGKVAQAFIQTAYGNAASSTLSGSYNDTAAKNFLPDNDNNILTPDKLWGSQMGLYTDVVAPICMTCHLLRGTKNQSDISFTTLEQFTGYADRIKYHVFDRGNMPLAKLAFADFWDTTSLPLALSQFLDTTKFAAEKNNAGAPLEPGRPLPDPGPDRVVLTGNTTLSAANSLFASSYVWSILTENGGTVSHASLSSQNSVTTTFNATQDGTYVLQLTAKGNGLQYSKPLTIVVKSNLSVNGTTYAPSEVRFSSSANPDKNIKTLFVRAGCTVGCHSGTLSDPVHPPLSYVETDYSGNEFYNTVKGRINFTDVAASPLLRKPSGHHHNGQLVGGAAGGFDIDTSKIGQENLPPGDGGREEYDLILSWILNGAPQ